MQTRTWFVFFGAGVAGVLTASVAMAQQPKRVDDSALRRAAQNGDEWLTVGRD